MNENQEPKEETCMNPKDFDQIKSYSTVIVAELHKVIFSEVVFDKLKAVLAVAEEMECVVMEMERKQQAAGSNVIPLRRIA